MTVNLLELLGCHAHRSRKTRTYQCRSSCDSLFWWDQVRYWWPYSRYSDSVAHAIEEIGRVDVKELTGLTVELTYSQYQVFSNFLEKEGIQEFDTTFLSDVSTTLFVEESEIERLGQELTEFYQGKVNYKKSGKKIVEIPI